jgi:hypothetical protein
MNFFRSEEHLRNWEGFQEDKKGGIIAVDALMTLFSGPLFRKRRETDYFSHMGEYFAATDSVLRTLEDAGSYWRLK